MQFQMNTSTVGATSNYLMRFNVLIYDVYSHKPI